MNGGPVIGGPSVCVWDDAPHPAALNMALDETLLDRLAVAEGVAVLRVYRWEQRAVSFGYFEPWTVVWARYGGGGDGWDFVRRWTGGGVVEHGEGIDWTYSLLLPRDPERPLPSSDGLYGQVHAALAAAMREVLGWPVELAAANSSAVSGGLNACFTRPVRSDVLLTGGRREKIAGAAQRRMRTGLLHQGSVRAVVPGEVKMAVLDARTGPTLAAAFARKLAGGGEGTPLISIRSLTPEVLAEAGRLAHARYANPAWTEKF